MQNLGFSDQLMKSHDDIPISDMDNFINTMSSLKSNPIQPDLIAPIITHYASKWIPELTNSNVGKNKNTPDQNMTSTLASKKLFIETLIGTLPPDTDSIPCNFLLRLLRAAYAAHVEPVYAYELERRASWQLDQASLDELMIPCFNHTSDTLLDVGLVLRLVKGFVSAYEEGSRRGSVAVVKVAKLVDCYLAEAAIDSHLALPEFIALAGAVPGHARATDDGLYRAVDTYLKAHPGLSKQERKKLCSLIDSRKLSEEACHHAAQNERMPVRAILHLLLSEQAKVNKHIIDRTGSLVGPRSPIGPDHPARCLSRREMGPQQQQIEVMRLKEDVLRLQSRCMAMERQIEKMSAEKKRSLMHFSWRKFGLIPALKAKRIGEIDEGEISEGGDQYGSQTTPLEMKVKLIRGKNRRRSLS